MSEGLDDQKTEKVLNVFREKYPTEKTLTTDDLEDALSVGKRTVQDYVKELHESGHLELEAEGKPNHWRLAATEPTEPIYRTELAKAKRLGNQAAKVGRFLFVVSIGVLAAVGLITSNHFFAEAFNLYLPFLDTTAASSAILAGVIGSALFGIASVALLVSVALPRVAEWYIDDTLPSVSSPKNRE